MEPLNTPPSFRMMGFEMNVKVSKNDSGNKISAIEQTVAPGAGSPPHILNDADKMIYVIEGKFLLRNGDQYIEGDAGTMVYIRRGVVHNFKNTGSERGKILVTLTPGGHEEFLYDLSLRLEKEKPTPELMQEVGSRHRVEMVI